MRKPLFTPAQVAGATALRATYDPEFIANWFAEGAVTRVSNAIMEKLEAGELPRRLRHGISQGCVCFCCRSWQIVEIGNDGKETIVEETDDLMDWAHEQA